MDILEILKTSGDKIILEDLDCFIDELAIGNYAKEYILECLEIIENLKTHKITQHVDNDNKNISPNIVIHKNELLPKEISGHEKTEMSELDILKSNLQSMRRGSGHKSAFRKYVKRNSFIDEQFIKKNISVFDSPEMDVLLSEIAFSEKFLEDYYSTLDKKIISKNQLFSEKFFMKHFADLNYKYILTKSRNKWKSKKERSSQLDVFLRLKGIEI